MHPLVTEAFRLLREHLKKNNTKKAVITVNSHVEGHPALELQPFVLEFVKRDDGVYELTLTET